jgi:L-threonylcarbamoyladenylate synthase
VTRAGGVVATRVLAVDPASPDPALVREAAGVLRRGGLVALPTETFYGLAARALDPAAVARVFALKGRAASKALLVLVDGEAMVERVAAEIPPRARELMARHWPGALTLVLRARADVPVDLTGGGGTIGVRLSPHPVARAVVGALGEPVTAPSANLADAAPPTTADGVLRAFPSGVDLVLDAGATRGGPPSTVLDVTVEPPVVLRAGAVTVAAARPGARGA